MRKGKLIHFYRGARRHPKWDLGTPQIRAAARPFAPRGAGCLPLRFFYVAR